ncbi:unnamed protein product, partial [Didymodactylos carnosus]
PWWDAKPPRQPVISTNVNQTIISDRSITQSTLEQQSQPAIEQTLTTGMVDTDQQNSIICPTQSIDCSTSFSFIKQEPRSLSDLLSSPSSVCSTWQPLVFQSPISSILGLKVASIMNQARTESKFQQFLSLMFTVVCGLLLILLLIMFNAHLLRV